MDLLNATRMPAAYTMGTASDGRERWVVVVKGTFTLPCRLGETARLAEQQEPLVMADTLEHGLWEEVSWEENSREEGRKGERLNGTPACLLELIFLQFWFWCRVGWQRGLSCVSF